MSPRSIRAPIQLAALCAAAVLFAGAAGAQALAPIVLEDLTPGKTEQMMKQVKLVQRMNAQVPLDVTLRDDAGKTVRLGQYFDGKPVMLNLIQYRCRMLCSEEMNTLLQSLKQLQFTPGRDFNLLTVSIDPRETPDLAASNKRGYMREYGRPAAAAGWHFMTGDEPNIARLANAVGYHYAYDPIKDQFAHPDGIIILTPQGRVARYYFRLEYPARGLRLGLVESAKGKIGTPLDALALLCYHYDPATGAYTLAFTNVLRLAGLAFVLLLAVGILALKRLEHGHPSSQELHECRRGLED